MIPRTLLMGFLFWSGIVSASAAGIQLSGAHAAATNSALHPFEAVKKFVVPPGFEVRLFAAEPDVVNPVAMTWDERGRLWVVELFEYPHGAAPGAKPRDRIKILEDTDNDGLADKTSVFADGLNLATGLLIGHGGAYVGEAPNLVFLQDTNHDDKVDTRAVLLTGFGTDDRHELLNGFTWGPDGWLYMTHGVFTHSKVKIPEATEPGIEMNAAVARYHPRTKKFEVFAEGTSNPWGVDFDQYGNAFVSACVIDHLFHMSPGGSYQRQSGAPKNPYVYELLPSIVDHKHYMAAYCGICIYQGDNYPEEYRGRVFMGNIHQNAINHDRLIAHGSSFKAVAERDFLTTSDGWFMPVSQQVGPDGALWIADWYDKYPCYQNALADPEGVDRERGRIWRVVYVGKEPGKRISPRPDVKMNFGSLPWPELVKLLEHQNIWHRRTAQRLLSERHDLETRYALENLVSKGTNLQTRLAALWTLLARQQADACKLEHLLADPDSVIRSWAARISGEQRQRSANVVQPLEKAASDESAVVRLAVAVAARQYVSTSLTVDTDIHPDAPVQQIISTLIEASADGKDPLLPFMIWMAWEPLVAHNPKSALEWIARNGAATKPLSEKLTYKVMRRISDTGAVTNINHAMNFLATIAGRDEALASSALDGLVEGQKNSVTRPTADVKGLLGKLSSHPLLKERALQLGALWGDSEAIRAIISRINDLKLSIEERTEAIALARAIKGAAAREAVQKVITSDQPQPLMREAIRALGSIGGDSVADDLLATWNNLSPSARVLVADVLVSRSRWAMRLLSAVEVGAIRPTELSVTAIRSLADSNDKAVRERAEQVIGRVRPTAADKRQLISEKRKMVGAGGSPDLQAGREIAKKACLVCHKLNGEGGEVGPDLDGVGRSSLDSLLANIIDPNLVVGKGYENVMIETKDDRSITGRLIEDAPSYVKVLSIGPKEEVVPRKDIASMRVSELSVMPEGLEQMPDEDFRNLIGYIMSAPATTKTKNP